MKDSEIFGFCRKNNIQLPASWRHSCQAVRYHNREETSAHFMAKARIAYTIMSKGGTIFTELEITTKKSNCARMKHPVCDLLWLDEKIVIEFESACNPEALKLKSKQFEGFNLFVFDLRLTGAWEMMQKLGLG